MITTIRDGRKVYHWPASIRELVEARQKTKEAGGDPTIPLWREADTREGEKYHLLRREAREAAGNWQLCACGSLCRAIPRVYEPDNETESPKVEIIPNAGEPKDWILLKLGLDFNDAILEQDYGLAFVLMEKIEERAAVVLSKLGKKPKAFGPPNKRK